ncbi:MAG: hypothetical protein WAS27_04755, partial [Candidatus Saccharimonadales bacterium]
MSKKTKRERLERQVRRRVFIVCGIVGLVLVAGVIGLVTFLNSQQQESELTREATSEEKASIEARV